MMAFEAFLAQVKEQFGNRLPIVAYRKPNESTVRALLQSDTELHLVTDFTESGFVFAPFDTVKNTVLIPKEQCKTIECEFVSTINQRASQHQDTDNTADKQVHIALVQNALEAIEKKDFHKVVVSRRETILINDNDPSRIFLNLLDRYPTAFVYFFFHPKVGLWLGATPETLLRIEGNKLTTMSLAGTQKYNATTDVVWLQKEKEEQQIVTDFIVEGLHKSVDKIEVSEVQTVRAGHLLHLKTDILATIHPKTFHMGALLEQLHPTPAVCGLPKSIAKRFILQNEQYDREYYTGFLGELNFKEKLLRNPNGRNIENNAYASVKLVSQLYVNLRCMQLKDNQVSVYVGGGITKDSVPEKEWEETVSKSQIIKSIL